MPSHRVQEDWMGEEVTTLEDLLRPGLRVVCVGVNPAPPSVEAGHYYLGQAGRQFLGRLHEVGVIPQVSGVHDDDAAFEAGAGFTDIVKRPTRSAREVTPNELEYGAAELRHKLAECRPRAVIFTFKRAARAVFGDFSGNGWVLTSSLPAPKSS